MRATELMFRNPAQATPGFYDSDNRKTSLPQSKRFAQYDQWRVTTGRFLGPGTYDENESYKKLTKKPCTSVMAKSAAGFKIGDKAFVQSGHLLKYEPGFEERESRKTLSTVAVNEDCNVPIKSSFQRMQVVHLRKAKQRYTRKDRAQQEVMKYHEYGFKFSNLATEPTEPGPQQVQPRFNKIRVLKPKARRPVSSLGYRSSHFGRNSSYGIGEFRTVGSSAEQRKDMFNSLKPVLPYSNYYRVKRAQSATKKTIQRPSSAQASPFRPTNKLSYVTIENVGGRYFNIPSTRTEKKSMSVFRRLQSNQTKNSNKNSQYSWAYTAQTAQTINAYSTAADHKALTFKPVSAPGHFGQVHPQNIPNISGMAQVGPGEHNIPVIA